MEGIQKWLEFLESQMLILQARGAMIQKFSLKDLEVKQALFKVQRETFWRFFLKCAYNCGEIGSHNSQLFCVFCVARISLRTHWSISMSRSQVVRFTAKVLQVAIPRRNNLSWRTGVFCAQDGKGRLIDAVGYTCRLGNVYLELWSMVI